MKLSEKTILGVYLQTTIVVLGLVLVFQKRIQEAFVSDPRIKCVGPDGTSQCRFVDPLTITDASYIIWETSEFVPTYDCSVKGETIVRTFNLKNKTCDAPSDSTTAIKALDINPLLIQCGFGERYNSTVGKCAKVVGTIEKCIKPDSTATSDDVKKAMPCYAARYPDLAEKYRNDTALLYDDYLNIGRYLLRNPCCEEGDTLPAPSGSINLFGYTVKKDWKFWTGFAVFSVLIVIIVIGLVTR